MRIRHLCRLAALAALATAAASCGDVVRSSRAPVMLTVNSLGSASASGATTMQSDVAITKAPCSVAAPCVADDNGQAVIGVVMKDVTVAPTTNNQVTITRYHVSYRRADGRNTPGTDVPFAFDGAVTTTIQANASSPVVFNIVRGVAKLESPLVQLRQTADVITAIADVTFFGTDQVGNEVSVTGSILINFGNFSDS